MFRCGLSLAPCGVRGVGLGILLEVSQMAKVFQIRYQELDQEEADIIGVWEELAGSDGLYRLMQHIQKRVKMEMAKRRYKTTEEDVLLTLMVEVRSWIE